MVTLDEIDLDSVKTDLGYFASRKHGVSRYCEVGESIKKCETSEYIKSHCNM